MGINGLLKKLQIITRTVNLRESRGQCMALDASCVLHRRAALQPREHALDCEDSNLIPSCIQQVRYLRRHGIEPIVVFDGDQLPMKAAEEEKRNSSRESSFKKACELEAAGDMENARKYWCAAAAVKPHHVKRLIEALKAEPEPFRFIVAPYEADAQCAYLALTGRVDAVITDDSDLLCYGCPRVLFKTDFWAGTAQEIRLEDLAKNTKPDFLGWDVDLFQELCVLSGCDFLNNVPNRAIMKVHKGLSEYRSGLKYIRWLRTVAGADVPPNYELSFLRARATFRHQLVYCPDRQECLHLTPVPEEGLRIEEAMGVPLDLLQFSLQESYDTKSSGQNSQSSSSRGLISSNSSSSRGPISSGNSSSSSSADSIGDCDNYERGCGSAISGDSPLSFLGPMVPPDVAAAVARGDLDARTKQPFCASTLTPTFTPEHARALGLRDVTGATESHGKTASDQSSASTSSSRGNSNSSRGSSQAASTEAAVAAAQGQGGEQGASNSSSARALCAEAADSVPERKRSASVWEAAKGVSAKTSLPNLSMRPPLTRRSRFRIRLSRPSRGVSPASLPCQPLHPHRSFGTTKLSTISGSSCSCCHTSGSKISSRMSARPIIALGHSLAHSAPMLLRRVFI